MPPTAASSQPVASSPAQQHAAVSSLPSGPVRAGLIGFGFAGQTFHAPLLRCTPGLELVAVASSQPATVAQQLGAGVAVCASPEALLTRADVELVVIATPNASHAPLAEAALRAGKAVVVDKPFALNAEEAARLVALAEREQRLLSVFHNRRWDGDFLTAQALLRAGTLGRVAHAALHFDRFRPQVRARWREAAQPGGGLFIDLTPHLMDQALQLFGEPETLSADIAALRDDAQGDDFAQVHLRYACGLRVNLHASTLAAMPGPRFELQGTRGAWRSQWLDPQEDALRAGLRPDTVPPGTWGQHPQPERRQSELVLAEDPSQPDSLRHTPWPLLSGDYPAYYAGIVAALRGLGPNPVPAAQALRVMVWLDKARESARRGQRISA